MSRDYTNSKPDSPLPGICVDSCELMIQLATMAGMPHGNINRMVLVLDVNDMPRLYVSSLLRGDGKEPLHPVKLETKETDVEVNGDTLEVKETTTHQNSGIQNDPTAEKMRPYPQDARANFIIINGPVKDSKPPTEEEIEKANQWFKEKLGL